MADNACIVVLRLAPEDVIQLVHPIITRMCSGS